MNKTQRPLVWLLFALLITRLLTLGFYPLFDTTEARYAEIARKMVELNDWITPWDQYGIAFWAKPPLSFWASATSLKLFGINEFAARLPHFLLGILILWLVWNWLARSRPVEALYAIVLLAASLLFFASAGAVMTDMSLALGCIITMRGLWVGLHGSPDERRRERWLLFIGAGIGLLAKGPIALVLTGMPILLWTVTQSRVSIVIRAFPWFRGLLLTLLISLPWYLLTELHTPGFINYFILGEHWHRFITPGWKGDMYGHAHVFPRGAIWGFTFLGVLPWSILLPLLILWNRKSLLHTPRIDTYTRSWRWFLLLWGLTPCVFFTLAANIIWTYDLPGLPALAMCTASWLTASLAQKKTEKMLCTGLVVTLIGWLAFMSDHGSYNLNDSGTTKSLVAEYEKRRHPNEALIFYRTPPYSAEFYTRGKVESLRNMADMGARLNGGAMYLAISKRQLRLQPLAEEFKNRLKLIDDQGDFELFYAE